MIRTPNVRVFIIVSLLFFGFFGFAQTPAASFHIAMDPSPIEWNPLYTYTSTEAQLYTAIYEGLVGYDPRTLQPIPAVASEWEVSDDGMTYTFTLRPNARFSDGRPVRAENFRDTWLELLKPQNQTPFGFLLDVVVGAQAFRTGRNADPMSVGIRALGAQTLEIQLQNPAPHFLSILAHQSLVPLPQEFLSPSRWTEAGQVPSNGPFVLQVRSGSRLEFEKNPFYWDSSALALDKIVILLRDDPLQNSQDYNAGSLDWVIGSFDSASLRVPASLQIGAQFATTYLFPNTARKGLSDPEVRRALFSFIPWEEIRSSDVYFVPSSRLVPEITGYPSPNTFTPLGSEEALDLLEVEGFPNGHGLLPLKIALSQGSESERIGEILQKAWSSALGGEVELNFYTFSLLQEIQKTGDFDISLLSWVGDYADPLTFLDLWREENPINLGRFRDRTFEELLDQAPQTEGETRFSLLSQAESYLLRTGGVIPISHSPSINVIDLSEIDGWYVNPLDIHPFKYLKIQGARAPRDVTLGPGGILTNTQISGIVADYE
ncbi:MAG: peptide ABC transporter substrate-binding protein [Spirochaetales bacterium]|nr:peptide ABC transporter substrate-binding protein [Spirochaetales bacterium]